MTFEQDIIKDWMRRRRVRLPKGAQWEAIADGNSLVLTLSMPTIALGDNFQNDSPSAPFFLFCLAYWHEQLTGTETRCRVRLEGTPPRKGTELLHWRRALILFHDLQAMLGNRFQIDLPAGDTWPPRPILNRALKERGAEHSKASRSEHALEVQLTKSAQLRSDFNARVAPLAAFSRQLPVGLFDGVDGVKPRAAAAWTPGRQSQVDLWGISADGTVLHGFELKTAGNRKVGILPEALYYARLLHHVRLGKINGSGPAIDAVRRARRIVMWLIAPAFHPLVLHERRSPLAWLNEGMARDHVELRILPFELCNEGIRHWLPEQAWPVTPFGP